MTETAPASAEQDKRHPVLIELSELDLASVSETEAFREILDALAQNGIDQPERLLFCGFEGAALLAQSTHGERRTFYALTAEEYATQAELEDRNGSEYGGTPLKFARRDSDEQPVIAIYDSAMVSAVDAEDVQYESDSLDDALVAVIKLV